MAAEENPQGLYFAEERPYRSYDPRPPPDQEEKVGKGHPSLFYKKGDTPRRPRHGRYWNKNIDWDKIDRLLEVYHKNIKYAKLQMTDLEWAAYETVRDEKEEAHARMLVELSRQKERKEREKQKRDEEKEEKRQRQEEARQREQRAREAALDRNATQINQLIALANKKSRR